LNTKYKLNLRINKSSCMTGCPWQTADHAHFAEVIRLLPANETKPRPIMAQYVGSALGPIRVDPKLR